MLRRIPLFHLHMSWIKTAISLWEKFLLTNETKFKLNLSLLQSRATYTFILQSVYTTWTWMLDIYRTFTHHYSLAINKTILFFFNTEVTYIPYKCLFHTHAYEIHSPNIQMLTHSENWTINKCTKLSQTV